jgi:hypothetical protein
MQYTVLMTTPKRKRPLEKNMHRSKGNIKTGVKVTRWKDVDWIHLHQDGKVARLVKW